ncbi:MAG: hypothetical protein CMF62_01445 [Magnetococcales bacterium]|nr:hypothetical protein [Magnetococcales bacterium]|tara:strand:+ start:17216 stop:17776 length:561 start_codon:yes stop_codon:yes gene_type:complete
MSDIEDNNSDNDYKFPKFFGEITNRMKKISRDLKDLKNDMKKMETIYNQDLKKSRKNKNQKKKVSEATGFNIDEIVPDEIAELVGIEKGTKMPRTKLTSELYKVLKERKLYYEKDKRILRADDEIKRIFDLNDEVNQVISISDPKGFTFYNIQKFLAKKYKQMKDKDVILNNNDKKKKKNRTLLEP